MTFRQQISICSTSYFEYDRRMLRIIGTLSDMYDVVWISRSYKSGSQVCPDFRHMSINTFFRKGIMFYLEINIRILIALLRSRSGVFYAVDLDTLGAVYLAARIKRRPLIFDAHELFYEVPELEGKPVRRKIWESLARVIIPRLKYCLTVNDSLKEHYEKAYGTSFSVIRNVPDLIARGTEISMDGNNKKLIYIGALNEGRGLEEAIDAIARLPGYELMLVGEGDLSEQLKNRAKASPAENRIDFRGFVSPDKLPELLDGASIGLNMLKGASKNYYYSLGNKFFDYMHAAVPAVHMDYPEYRNIVRKYPVAVLVQENSSDALIEALHKLEDGQFYDSLVEACRSARKVYNWQIESEKLKVFMTKISPSA